MGNPDDLTIVTSSTRPSATTRNWTSAVPSIPDRRASGGYRLALSILSRRSCRQSAPLRPAPPAPPTPPKAGRSGELRRAPLLEQPTPLQTARGTLADALPPFSPLAHHVGQHSLQPRTSA